jgi:hypothetical protein
MKDKYIAAKECWAAKQGGQPPRERSGERLPPGQQEAKNFPVLDLAFSRQWRARIGG